MEESSEVVAPFLMKAAAVKMSYFATGLSDWASRLAMMSVSGARHSQPPVTLDEDRVEHLPYLIHLENSMNMAWSSRAARSS